MVFKKKQTAVDEQIAEIDKLNAVINAAERDMLKLRKVWSLSQAALLVLKYICHPTSHCGTMQCSLHLRTDVSVVQARALC